MSKGVRIVWKTFLIGWLLLILVFILTNFGLFGKMPSIYDLQNPSASLSSEVFASDGTLMGKFYTQDRSNVDYKDISPYVIQALVATEDKRFYEHSGIDAKGTMAIPFYLAMGKKRGSSTITQQLALNLFAERARNPFVRAFQKLKEYIIAVKLERNFTKEEIISLYLNTVPFGENIYGIRGAARTFFSKEPDRLTIEEAAVLVGMLNANTAYNPVRNPKASQIRRNFVYEKMVENNVLTEQEAAILKKKPIVTKYQKLNENNGIAPYFREELRGFMKKWCKQHKKPGGDNYDIYKDGLKIYTTINPVMQQYAEEAVASHMASMQKLFNNVSYIKDGSIWNKNKDILDREMKASDRWKNMKSDDVDEKDIEKTFYIKVPMKVFAWNQKREKDTIMTPIDSIKYMRQMLQCGMIAMDPATGEIKAWVGGIDFKNFKYDHCNLNTTRQVGSTIKPLLYANAVEEAGFTAETPVQDVQQNFGALGWVPATGASCTGRTVPMANALAFSRNCASAYIMKQIGPKRFVEFLKTCNIQNKVPAYPSIALGACELSVFEMIWAYSIFPNNGFSTQPIFINRIEDKNGNVLQSFVPERKEVISSVGAYQMVQMMKGVVDFGTAKAIHNYGAKGEIAGKTGTTNDNTDAWFMGYTPQLLAGVWVGCDDNFLHFPKSSALGYGGYAAMPVWSKFVGKCQDDKKATGIDANAKFTKPENMDKEIILDYMQMDGNDLPPGAEGYEVGTDSSAYSDFKSEENIGAESKALTDEEKNILKEATGGKADSSKKQNKDPQKNPGNKPDEKKKVTKPENDYR
jgi:penicillin-binding protein 1A